MEEYPAFATVSLAAYDHGMPDLERYRRKRDFSKTPEPRAERAEAPPPGDPDASSRNLIFVVQQHAATRMHWDFRLEAEGVLKSWPLPKGPTLNPKERRMAVMTEDHPYDYRNFEGVIPKGQYGGGQVIIWDEGIFTPDEDGVTSWDDKEEGSRRLLEGIARGKLSFTLQGKKLRGSFALVKTKYAPDSWLLLKHRDEFASERDVLQDDRSVRSGLTILDLKEGRMPAAVAAEPQPDPGKQAPFPDARKERPMLSTLVEKAFDKPGWLWEPKLDGVRALAYLKDGKADLRSRRGIEITRQYPGIVDALRAQGHEMVLDGEICALDENGAPRFHLLQPRINLTKGADPRRVDAEIPVVFFAFDLLYLDGRDLRPLPLRERRRLLERNLRTTHVLSVVTQVADHGVVMAENAGLLGFEGVIGKRADSRYEAGTRSPSWVKVKTTQRQEFLVAGYTAGEGGRRGSFGALALGYYDDGGVLQYAGNVGSGFSEPELKAMKTKLSKLAADAPAFAAGVKVEGEPSWVRPEIVIEVKFAEWTQDGRLRAPVFEGLREDIDPASVRRERPLVLDSLRGESPGATDFSTAPDGIETEIDSLLAQLENPRKEFAVQVDGSSLRLSNLDKVFWPAFAGRGAISKRDLIRYYVKVAPFLLPHLKDRPLTLTRYPNGIEGQLFYQKHYGQPIPGFVETVDIWSSSNEGVGRYILCNNLATLVWLAQIAGLELHAWMSRIDPEPDAAGKPGIFDRGETELDASVLNYPDYMIFDLDPYTYAGTERKGEEPRYNARGWQQTVDMALALKDVLEGLQLSTFLKTSGKTGLHVYAPILRRYDYDELRAVTQVIGRYLLQLKPQDVTMEWDTARRAGKVFFDHNQNTRGKTLAAQYSLRPTAWAGVSTPIAWSELPGLDATSLNIATVPDRLDRIGDPWAGILQHKNDLSRLLDR